MYKRVPLICRDQPCMMAYIQYQESLFVKGKRKTTIRRSQLLSENLSRFNGSVYYEKAYRYANNSRKIIIELATRKYNDPNFVLHHLAANDRSWSVYL